MKIYWDYKKENLTFDEAVAKIESIGFTRIHKGLVRQCHIRKYRRYHFVHTGDERFNLHEDTKFHTVAKGEKSENRLRKIISELYKNHE